MKQKKKAAIALIFGAYLCTKRKHNALRAEGKSFNRMNMSK